jgi:hypothetical protein
MYFRSSKDNTNSIDLNMRQKDFLVFEQSTANDCVIPLSQEQDFA